MNWIKDYPHIAHRGLHSNTITENTEKAFSRAIKENVAIELDVQFLLDGTPVVFHDHNLNRLLGNASDISQVNPRFISYLKYKDGQTILTLNEALELINEQVPVLIEIKRDSFKNADFKKFLLQLSQYRGRFSLQSFDPNIVASIKSLYPHFSAGQLVTNWGKADIALWQQWAMKCIPFIKDCDFLSIDYNITKPWHYMYANARELPLLAWTITNEQQANKALNDFDGVIFEGFLPS